MTVEFGFFLFVFLFGLVFVFGGGFFLLRSTPKLVADSSGSM